MIREGAWVMGNSLLDFVMSLVRDPDAAARYAADPSQALADAHLPDVTSADVNSLIPVVSESLSMATPGHGADAADHNVWASGAATAAFDAFSDHVPEPVISEAHPLSPAPADHVPDQPSDQVTDQPLDHPLDVGLNYAAEPGADLHPFGGFDQPLPADESHLPEHHLVDDHGITVEHPNLDIF
jgi:hypothetical protein